MSDKVMVVSIATLPTCVPQEGLQMRKGRSTKARRSWAAMVPLMALLLLTFMRVCEESPTWAPESPLSRVGSCNETRGRDGD